MNNIVALHSSAFPRDSSLYFPTWERPLSFSGMGGPTFPVKSHKAIVRIYNENPHCLGIVGKNYKVVSHEAICKTIEQSFINSFNEEQLQSVRVGSKGAYCGGTMLRDYVFPEVKVKVGDSEIGFRTIVKNSYDGSTGIRVYAGGISFFCENGMINGEFDMFVARHAKGFEIKSLQQYMNGCIDIFYKQAEIWQKWYNQPINREQAETVLQAIPNASEALVKKLLRQYDIEVLSHGRTIWALYNAATYYATHDEGDFKVRSTDNDHTNSTLHDRETKIMRWTNTEEFKQLAA